MENREVKPFTMWRHFKGARSFVITVAQQWRGIHATQNEIK